MAHDHSHHNHSHGHDHSHGHAGHSHAPDNFGWAFAVGAALNTAFVIAELIFGYAANSLALISDAVHNLSDVVALLLAWGAAWLSPGLDPGGSVQRLPAAGCGRRHCR
jgi:cobalt-zinc-cadmium efflux system protein